MPTTLREFVRCPKCGSAEIIYSCEPKCCFNHVCADCRSTFEINTQKTGIFDRTSQLEFCEPNSGDPTTACVNCDSLNLAVLRSDAQETLLVCGKCRSVLKLALEEFVPGNF